MGILERKLALAVFDAEHHALIGGACEVRFGLVETKEERKKCNEGAHYHFNKREEAQRAIAKLESAIDAQDYAAMMIDDALAIQQ